MRAVYDTGGQATRTCLQLALGAVNDMDRLSNVLVCPRCRTRLGLKGAALVCEACASSYTAGTEGFLDFGSSAGGARESSPRLQEYAAHQEGSGERRYLEYLRPWIRSEPTSRILDVGCGVGTIAELMAADGLEAFGVDLPKAARFWADLGRDPERFFTADAEALPFEDGFFDAVTCIGVIEHVGTVTGHCTLSHGFEQARVAFVRELVRLVRPGGRILVACPNKSFPIDFHHGPGDALSGPGRARSAVARRTGLNVHKTWGSYHLPSYGELHRWFRGAGARSVRPLLSKGFFSFDGLKGRVPVPAAILVKLYVERLPGVLRGTALDPFVLAEVRR